MGFTELLQKGSLPIEQQKTYLSYIATSSKQLLRVLNDIIDISSIETGQMELNYEECNLDELCYNLMKVTEREKIEYNKTDLQLVFENEGQEDQTYIITDKKRLTQILYNLLNNALSYTNEGSIRLRYKIIDKKVVQLQVQDTGLGIERSKYEVIFERFRQIDESTKRQQGGSGLGLAISKELLNMMHGRIRVESKVGTGSTFTVEIPYKAVIS
jgi:signal transduction histidine kinase